MALADMYGFEATTAYYFFVVLETGFAGGNLMITFGPQRATASTLKKSLCLNVIALGLLSLTEVTMRET